jgi:hypothetical protein
MNRGLYAGLPRTTVRMRGVNVDGQTGATAVGDQTGPLVSTNTYIGYQAGQNTTLGGNTFVGYQAGQGAAAFGDVCVGYQAGLKDIGGSNVFVGYQAGMNNVNNNAVVAIGYQAGLAGGSGGVAIGYTAGSGGLSNTGCVAIGNGAGGAGITNGTVAIGNASANAAATSSCVCIGSSAGGGNNSTLVGTVAVGYSAFNSAFGSTGTITCVGYFAGHASTTGNNTFFGYQSGYSPAALGTTYATTTGTGQTCIGYQTGQAVVSATAPNYITCLGYETTVGASGGVAIGTDHTGAAATTSTQDAFQLGTSNHTIVSSGKVKMAAHGITSGALSTVTLSSGTGAQVDTTCDRYIAILGTAVLATDTIAIALSADNTTYTTLGTLTPGVASTDIYTIMVPAGWYCRVTASGSASIVANSVYY